MAGNFAWRLISSTGDIPTSNRKNDLVDGEVIQLKGVFNHFDDDRDGLLSVPQLAEALQCVGFPTRDKFLRKFCISSNQMKIHGIHSMAFKTDFKTFVTVINKEIKCLSSLGRELDALFAFVDVNETGHLSRKELRFLLVEVETPFKLAVQEFTRFVKGLIFSSETDSVSISDLKRHLILHYY
jgi:Ca2+-binding EF-hand superfamily protein